MASKTIAMRCAMRAHQCANTQTCRLVQIRHLCCTPRWQTDGVFRALTEQRMQVPWIEAFRKQQRERDQKHPIQPPAPAKPDLTPKKMSDSYHSVVSSTRADQMQHVLVLMFCSVVDSASRARAIFAGHISQCHRPHPFGYHLHGLGRFVGGHCL